MWEEINNAEDFGELGAILWRRILGWRLSQKLMWWTVERGLTVLTIWLVVSCLVWCALNVGHLGSTDVLSAQGIAGVADKKLLVYLAVGWVGVIVLIQILQLLWGLKSGSQRRLDRLANHVLDELSSASTHAAFAYLFSYVIVAESHLVVGQTWAIAAFIVGGILGFNVDDRSVPVGSADLGLTIDSLKMYSLVNETQTVSGTVKRLPQAGYHLWAVRDWEALASAGYFYPGMELVITTQQVDWHIGKIGGAPRYVWYAPNFYFGGEPGHKRAFDVILVNQASHEKLAREAEIGREYAALRKQAGVSFAKYPTPATRWSDIEFKRCERIIVIRPLPQTG
ncbi:hypothetical protein [Burkholderia gladioli]|uniref:hypothetical protein n=1 Tax=Burkholderia gladioli TaxID=28095 RepID=UPI00164179E1|nr:hypothetical protein [Burkholderia gladioli]